MSKALSELLDQGNAALASGDTEHAISLFEKALALATSQGSDQSRGDVSQRLGGTYAACNRWSEAATHYEEAATIAHNLGPRFATHELRALHQTSQAYQALALESPVGPAKKEAYQKSQTAAQRMLDLARRERNGLAECMAWASLGNTQRGLGDYKAAAESISYAFAIAYEAGDAVAAADYLAELGYTQLLAGHAEDAGWHYEHGLILLETPDAHPSLAARLHDGIAEAYLAQNQAAAARSHAEQAVDLAQQAQDPYLEARHRSTLGRVLTRMGDYEAAARQHQAAIELFQKIKGRRAYLDLAGEYGNLATLYRLQGRYQPALETLEQAIAIAHQVGDQLAEGKWRDTLGSVYEELGDLDAAESCHRQALQIFEELGNNGEAATAHNNLGNTLYRRGLLIVDDELAKNAFESAAEHFRRACDGAQRAGDNVMAANATGNSGIVYLRTEGPEQAVKAFEEARDTLQAAGRDMEAGHQLENLGLAYAEYLGDAEEALYCYNSAIQVARNHGDTDGLRIALTRLGDLHRKQRQDYLAAQRAYEEAVELLNSGRAPLSLPTHRAGLLSRSLAAYEGLVRVHWQAGDFEAAFNWAERARARVFLEQVGLFAPLPDRGLPKDLLHKERDMIRRARALDQEIILVQDPIQRTTLARQRREIQDTLNGVWDEMAHSPNGGERYVALRRGTPATAKSLQAWLDQRADDTALLAYYSLPEAVYAWIFRSTQPVRATSIPLSQAALEHYIRLFNREVPGFRRYTLESRTWEEKLAPLITPLHQYLAGVQTVYLVPHKQLHHVTLHALPIGNEPLGETFPIAYAPSAGVLLRQAPAALNSPPRSTRAMVLGFTPHKQEESAFAEATNQAATIFDTQPYVGQEASVARFKREAPEAGLIYVLCHGEFNTQNPLNSCLHLDGDPLTARDILSINLPGTLVILTACQGGISGVNPGDELTGLSHAFLIAGASAVLAARWTVQTSSAIKLVREFYTHWHKQKTSPARALQQAMRTIRHHKQAEDNQPYAHPFFWAPFTLIGNAG
jgi:CHAT domain-containing protein/Flp pilus assembly protein TadD